MSGHADPRRTAFTCLTILCFFMACGILVPLEKFYDVYPTRYAYPPDAIQSGAPILSAINYCRYSIPQYGVTAVILNLTPFAAVLFAGLLGWHFARKTSAGTKCFDLGARVVAMCMFMWTATSLCVLFGGFRKFHWFGGYPHYFLWATAGSLICMVFAVCILIPPAGQKRGFNAIIGSLLFFMVFLLDLGRFRFQWPNGFVGIFVLVMAIVVSGLAIFQTSIANEPTRTIS